MLSFLLEKVWGFIVPNKIAIIIIGVLLSASIGSGYLLKQSYKDNGVLQANVEQLNHANDVWQFSYNELNKDLVEQKKQYASLDRKSQQIKQKITVVKDETNCLDTDMPDDLRLLFVPASSD